MVNLTNEMVWWLVPWFSKLPNCQMWVVMKISEGRRWMTYRTKSSQCLFQGYSQFFTSITLKICLFFNLKCIQCQIIQFADIWDQIFHYLWKVFHNYALELVKSLQLKLNKLLSPSRHFQSIWDKHFSTLEKKYISKYTH